MGSVKGETNMLLIALAFLTVSAVGLLSALD
jgi:hypothetical protein